MSYLQAKKFSTTKTILSLSMGFLHDDIRMGKVTIAFSYSFNVFGLSHSSLDGGTD